jgi:hypothetical protein
MYPTVAGSFINRGFELYPPGNGVCSHHVGPNVPYGEGDSNQGRTVWPSDVRGLFPPWDLACNQRQVEDCPHWDWGLGTVPIGWPEYIHSVVWTVPTGTLGLFPHLWWSLYTPEGGINAHQVGSCIHWRWGMYLPAGGDYTPLVGV